MSSDYVTMYKCDKCGTESIDPSKFREIGMIKAGDEYINENFTEVCLQCVPEILGIDIDPSGNVCNILPSKSFEEKN